MRRCFLLGMLVVLVIVLGCSTYSTQNNDISYSEKIHIVNPDLLNIVTVHFKEDRYNKLDIHFVNSKSLNGKITTEVPNLYNRVNIISDFSIDLERNVLTIKIANSHYENGLSVSRSFFDDKVLLWYKTFLMDIKRALDEQQRIAGLRLDQQQSAKLRVEREQQQEEAQLERERQQAEARIERNRQQAEANYAFADFIDIQTQMALKAGAPILIISQNTITPNSAGGVDCYVQFINISTKRMKYVDFVVVPYNRVDDVAYSEINNESEKTIQIVNYIRPNDYYDASWANVWYNSTIEYMKITSVKVTYDDNTIQVIDNSEIIDNASLSIDEYTEYHHLINRIMNLQK
jgi:hypothetical protein